MKKALEGLPGVHEVSFDPGVDAFAVEGASNLGQEEVRSAVLGTVVFPWLRSHLAGLSRFAGTSRKRL